MATKKQLSLALEKANIAYDILLSKYNTVLESYTDTVLEASNLRKENQMLKDVLKIADIPCVDLTHSSPEAKTVNWVSIIRKNG